MGVDELELAIDIHLKKLLDWLVSRRICNRNWHENVLKVRQANQRASIPKSFTGVLMFLLASDPREDRPRHRGHAGAREDHQAPHRGQHQLFSLPAGEVARQSVVLGTACNLTCSSNIIKLLVGITTRTYILCIQIVEILKETEADTRNFLGSYGSQRMKDWQEVISLYRKDNTYLAEAAQLLSQVR